MILPFPLLHMLAHESLRKLTGIHYNVIMLKLNKIAKGIMQSHLKNN